jgi:ferredoxin-type protein NapH
VTAGVRPGAGWRWSRRFTQALALLTIVIAPVLGGWQRLDRNLLSGWDGRGWDLPRGIMTRLPLGDAPSAAYDATVMVGGGASVEYFEVPIVDPVLGTLALASTHDLTAWILLAWAMPVALGILAGRVFCGWFCPFGVIARALAWIELRLWPAHPRPRLPARRWVRFAVLAAAVVAGALGAQVFLVFTLPHVLAQQAVYSMWLMGGGGAALGALLGLLLAGVVFGPTTYCASVCPTGATLAFLGRRRVVRLEVLDLAACGTRCDLCDRECWLALEPSRGTPGPDCDLCGRCTEVCPKDNMAMRARWGRGAKAATLAVLMGGSLAASSGCTASDDWAQRPALSLEQTIQVDGVDVFVSAVDNTGVLPDPDAKQQLRGSDLTLSLIRGPRPRPNRLGKLGPREFHAGPMRVRIIHVEGGHTELEWSTPNFPHSVGLRTIYQRDVDRALLPGDVVVIGHVEGWLEDEVRMTVPDPNVGADPRRLLGHVLVAFLAFGGLLLLSLVRVGRDPAPTSA